MLIYAYYLGCIPLLHSLKTGSWADQSIHLLMDIGAFTPGVKRPGREADNSPPSCAEVKNM
jgi:hypothetical protein